MTAKNFATFVLVVVRDMVCTDTLFQMGKLNEMLRVFVSVAF